jgi:CRP/FNR family cyclic AMP-dependent transcriptional regulator
MTLIEALGYLGAAVTLATYSMKTMIPLRVSGIVANILFIAFGWLGAVYPTLVLHAILLPLNCLRLRQMLQLVRRVRDASAGDLNMDWLKPFMSSRRVAAGEVLFRDGDAANRMYYVVSGRYRLVEIGQDVLPGTVVGELAFLNPEQTRTQTLECIESGEMLQITYDQIKQLYFQNPKFGFYFLRLASQRLFHDITRLEHELAARPAAQASA